MSGLLTDIIALLTGSITGVAKGIGDGLSELARDIFCTYTEGTGGAITITGLSVFGEIIFLFAGISLAIGLSRWVCQFITSLGARNR